MKKTVTIVVLASINLFSSPDMKSLFEGTNASGWILDTIGYFAIVPPANFSCEEKPGEVACRVPGEEASLHVNARLSKEAPSVGLQALNQYGEYEKELHFQMALDRPIKLGKLKGLERVYTYDYLGNVNYPVWVQIILVASGKILYEVKLKCVGRGCSKYQTIGEQIGANFRTAAVKADGSPIKGSLEAELKGASGYTASESAGSGGVDSQLEKILKELE